MGSAAIDFETANGMSTAIFDGAILRDIAGASLRADKAEPSTAVDAADVGSSHAISPDSIFFQNHDSDSSSSRGNQGQTAVGITAIFDSWDAEALTSVSSDAVDGDEACIAAIDAGIVRETIPVSMFS
jgi:hypothetical protein